MSIFDRILRSIAPKNELPTPAVKPVVVQEYSGPRRSEAGKIVSAETAMQISTAYRCVNIISDDIAGMPLQMFERIGRSVQRVMPDGSIRNTAFLIEVQPNRWMTPFIFKKITITWLIHWGNAYLWTPPGSYREIFVLRSDLTYPVFDQDGNLWYSTRFPSGEQQTIPAVEITHLMINSNDGLVGRSVLSYARETMGRQMAAHQTQNKILGTGLNPGGILYINGEVGDPAAREKVKRQFTDSIKGSDNAGGVAIFDNTVSKFESITMKPVDAQFLESMAATDAQIANYYGMPLYKLNQGKQSYESNEQQNMDYLRTTLDPYLVQWEQAVRMKWLRQEEQGTKYFKFVRESLLRTDAKSRAEYKKMMIESGQMTPNEARQIDDMSAYEGGDSHYFPSNMGQIQTDGSILGGSASTPVTK